MTGRTYTAKPNAGISNADKEAIGISLWDSKQSAEAYQRESYPEVQKLLAKSTEGTPQVKACEVLHSTVAKTARGSGGA
jgi:heme-degrading monooxygenase HmoA